MMLLIQIVSRLINVYSIILVIYALLSWFPGAYQSTLGQFIVKAVEPVLKPLRRFHLQFGGFDFTVLVAMLLLYALERVFIYFVLILF